MIASDICSKKKPVNCRGLGRRDHDSPISNKEPKIRENESNLWQNLRKNGQGRRPFGSVQNRTISRSAEFSNRRSQRSWDDAIAPNFVWIVLEFIRESENDYGEINSAESQALVFRHPILCGFNLTIRIIQLIRTISSSRRIYTRGQNALRADCFIGTIRQIATADR